MTSTIHPTAVIDEAARIGDNVEIGPFCVVGGDVTLHDGVRLLSHVVIEGDTTIGAETEVYPFASLGHRPQDLKFHGERTRLVIGQKNMIREHVTMNPGTEGGGGVTQVGDQCLFMVGSHVAHDCRIGDQVILANNATLAGHVSLGDNVIVGGLSAIHQFVRVGKHAFIGGMTGVEFDVIPYGMVLGERGFLGGLNLVGLRRRGFDREAIHTLRKAYRMIFSEEGTLKERVEDVGDEFPGEEVVQDVLSFIRAKSDRSFVLPKGSSGSQ